MMWIAMKGHQQELIGLQNTFSSFVYLTLLLTATIDFSMNTQHCFVRSPLYKKGE